MIRIRSAILSIIIGMLAFGCLDPIELDVPKGSEVAIVINAKVVKGKPSVFTMELSQLFSFNVESRARIIAKNAVISDKEGNELLIEPFADGLYYYEFQDLDPIQISDKKEYKLNVEMHDGRVFETSFEPLLPVPEIEKVTYNIGDKSIILPDQTTRTRTYVDYSIDTELFAAGASEKSYLRWELGRVYKITDSPIINADPKVCYVSEKSGVFDILIYDGNSRTIDRLDKHFLYEEAITREYGEGLYFTIIQEAISPSAYTYWENIQNITGRKDNIYADPAGKVVSNFKHLNGKEDVYGFFYVAAQDTARIYVSPEAAEFPIPRCPSPDLVCMDGSCCDPLCCDCLSVDNTTTSKPNYWIF